MSEVKQAAAAAGARKPQFRIVIDLFDDGDVNVNGPVKDKVLCYGLLECAKQIVAQFEPGSILLPSGEANMVRKEGKPVANEAGKTEGART